MTTKDVREQVKDLINGKVMAGPGDDPFETPMTFNEAVKAAEGLIEELGLVGSLKVSTEYWLFVHGTRQLRWIAALVVGTKSTQYEAATPERMIQGFRLELLKLIPNQPIDLGSVGIPSIPSEQGA